MTRPLALIEGDLSIPLPRPFDCLPPPFGSRRNLIREAVRRTAHETTRTRQANRFPPGVRHVLIYKAPPRRVDTRLYDAAVEEVKRYLEMGTIRPRSSRTDHVLSAAIFAGCTIALTWLLITCSMKEGNKPKAPDAMSTLASSAKQRADQSKVKPRIAVADRKTPVEPGSSVASQAHAAADQVALAKTANDGAQLTSSAPTQVAKAAPYLVPVSPSHVTRTVPRPVVQFASRREEHATTMPLAREENRVKAARLSGSHVNERVALSRAKHSATHPTVSAQPEWTAKASGSQNIASTDNAAPWLNWSAPQQRPVMRAATPVDNHWNDHMSQRRITDDPTAFNIERSGQ